MAANYDRVLLPPFQPQAPSQLSLPSLHEIFPEYVPKPSHRAPAPQTPHVYHSRHASTSSSSTTSSARSSPSGSPSPPPYSAASSSPPPYSPSPVDGQTVRIVRADSFDGADAVLLYAGPMKAASAPRIIAHLSQLNPTAFQSGAPLLLVKAALHAWKASPHNLPAHIRAQPYKLQSAAPILKEVVRKC
ncbi:unnamed protein product [Peniophora sp. CBMAI 1063]|nr:unnamed protein product [Peniophora sp. CBMAI 1063]